MSRPSTERPITRVSSIGDATVVDVVEVVEVVEVVDVVVDVEVVAAVVDEVVAGAIAVVLDVATILESEEAVVSAPESDAQATRS